MKLKLKVFPSSHSITSFWPESGMIGSSVIIFGTNFSPVFTENKVEFNGIRSIVLDSTPTQLTVTVPAKATSGPIAVIVNDVAVLTINHFTVVDHKSKNFSIL